MGGRKMKDYITAITAICFISLLLYAKYKGDHRFIPEEVKDEILPVPTLVITNQDTTIYVDDMPVHIIIK